MSFYPPAERELFAHDALALVARRFPEIPGERIEHLGTGFDNVAYLIDGEWVFRFCRRELGVRFLETELAVVPRLAGRLPVAIPNLQFSGTWGEPPWPFAGHRIVRGRSACTLALSDGQRLDLVPAIAEFLSAVHAIPVDEARSWGAGPHPMRRIELEQRPRRIREHLARIAERRLLDVEPLGRLLDALVEQLRACDLASEPLVLLHGDLYSRHLLLDEDLGLCGVIDWGDVHVGNVGIDLSLVHAFLPPSAHERFLAAYGPVSDRVWACARFHALAHETAVVMFADEVGDGDLLREGLVSLGHLRVMA